MKYLKSFFISFLPIVFFAPYTSNLFVSFHDKPTDSIKSIYTNIFLALGGITMFTINYYYKESVKKRDLRLENQNKILRLNVDNIIDNLSHQIGYGGRKFNIRVFKVSKVLSVFPIKHEIVLEDVFIEHITDKINSKNPLKFIASNAKLKKLKYIHGNEPPEGVVGKCYKIGTLFVDFDTSDSNQYTLTEKQKSKIGKVGFCCATPIFDDKNKNGMTHVVSLDSEKNILKNDKNIEVITEHLQKIGQLFDEYIV